MHEPSSNGSYGEDQVNITTIDTAMTKWLIPAQFRDEVSKNIRLLVLAAIEGTYLAQGFMFNVTSEAQLTTLIIATRRAQDSANANASVAVMFVTIDSRAAVKQLYSVHHYQHCWICPKCLWISKCCCEGRVRHDPRGHSPEELSIVMRKIRADQSIWFNEHFSKNKTHMSSKRSLFRKEDSDRLDLVQIIEKYISKNTVKAEVLASYNDSILSALQSNMTSLKLSTEALKLTKIRSENVPILLTSLANNYGFDLSQFNSQQYGSERFSFEHLFTSSIDNASNEMSIKYIWIIGQQNDNSTFTIHFLYSYITSKLLIRQLLANISNEDRQLKILRTSTFDDNGEFLKEQLSTYITTWQVKTTHIALNILRFIGATKLVPVNRYRMLSYFNPEILSPKNMSNIIDRSEPRSISAKIIALSQAVSSATKAVKDVIDTIKSSSSTTITRVTRFGFNYFNQKSSVLKAMEIPAARAEQFIQALILDYNLPSKGSFMLGLTYSDDFAWDSIQYLYSPSMNGSYRSLTVFKNGDSIQNTASFFIVDINANWDLAPDLLIITKQTSILGGLWSSSKQSIQQVPHVLTLDEAMKLQQFFMAIALSNMVKTFGVNVTFPTLQ
ncbi:unnamed protein product [Rotaria sp. Silwood2]|nr:unnamed protein product [Rotaria sp. Silwood2]CAF4513099.1 unnamed protein product [Rotaria sp. Silwood2]CAF4595747.1 unnamed protein product [Rotaria sp. Silwood2]